MSTASRAYLSKAQQTFRDFLNYLDIQHNKPDPTAYINRSAIRVVHNKDGLTSIFLEHGVSKKVKPAVAKDFRENSVQTCREIISVLQTNQNPFSLVHNQRFIMEKSIALELFDSLQAYAKDFGKDIYISNGSLPQSKILVIHPSTEEAETIARHAAFRGDIRSVNMKITNETERIQRRKSIIGAYKIALNTHSLNFAQLTETVLPKKYKTSMIESRIARDDLLRYCSMMQEIEQNTLDGDYVQLLTQTRGNDLSEIYQQIYPLKNLIKMYRETRMKTSKGAPAKMKSLEESLLDYSYKNF